MRVTRALDPLLFAFLAVASSAASGLDIPVQAPGGDEPTEIAVRLRILKIFDVQPVEKTFKIDSYVNYTWKDTRNARFIPEGKTFVVFEDRQVDAADAAIWNPSFEIINNTGLKEVSNKRLIIESDGTTVFNERFKATLSSEMDFRLFPFDYHILNIDIEAFSHDAETLRFSQDSSIFPIDNGRWDLTSWEVIDRLCYISTENYAYLDESTDEDAFHRFSFELKVGRIPGYFVWQIILPLLVIMGSSWCAVFVKDFPAQIGLVSTLMLTVYAFNFFISDSIPKLPYNTYLEMIIIASFVNIFLQLVGHLLVHGRKIELSMPQSLLFAMGFCFFFILSVASSWYVAAAKIADPYPVEERRDFQVCDSS